ncbi:hypothetical protein HPB49_026369 [Dermacentor silvarum]|nr:hypothetical protein HPB49_026369 [Dermacentor silvarum]
MRSYRSLKAYGLAMEGHVHKVLISDLSMECCFLKAEVTPSQRTTAKPYETWALVCGDGSVHTAHCTCMAGLGEVCAHVAALLFKVELLVSSGFARSTTSQLCEWNNKFRESVEPTRVRDLNIVKHRHGKVSKGVNRKRSAAQAPKAKFPGILDSLYSVLPNAAVFTAFSKYATLGEETDSADEGEIATELPESLYEMYDKTWETLNQSAREEKIDSLLKMRMSHSDVAQIEEKTRVQRKCLLWFQQRCGRITGSVFSKVVKFGTAKEKPVVLVETQPGAYTTLQGLNAKGGDPD